MDVLIGFPKARAMESGRKCEVTIKKMGSNDVLVGTAFYS
jgi:hypothetical protein